MSDKTRSSGIKDALVIKHCIKMWPGLIKREESAFCNESWKLSKPYTAKSVTRQSCIPLCNIGSSSGNSSQGNFALKDATSKRSFFKQYHAYQFNFQENLVHGTSVVGNQGIFVPDALPERSEHNGNLNIINNNNSKQGHAAFPPTNTSCESTGNAGSSTYELSNFDDTVDENGNNELCTPLTTKQLHGSFATKNKIVNIHGSPEKRWKRNRVRKRSRGKINLMRRSLFLAFVATFFCCSPFGIVALYYMWKVKRALAKNKVQEAWLFSLKGRKLANAGIKIAITIWAFAVIILLMQNNVPYSTPEYDYYLPDYTGG